MKDFYLPEFYLPKEEHLARQAKHEQAGQNLKIAWKCFDMTRLDNLHIEVPLSRAVPLASDPRWSKRPFGAVGTVETAGCVAMMSKFLLDFFEKDVSMEDLLIEIEQKGYRMWKLEKSSKTLTTPYLELASLKAAYSDDDPIQKCSSLKEVFSLYGKPVGIGGSAFLVDQIINYLSDEPIDLYLDTRIHNVYQIIFNLEHGYIVPMRVNNAIYHSDPERKGGHYLTLVGLSGKKALLADSSCKSVFRTIPFHLLMEAILADEKLICVWNVSPL